MRFLIIGDLHGNMPRFYVKKFDAIIAPGDFCSDALRKYMFAALKKNLAGSNLDWYDLMSKEKAKKEVDKSIRDGRKILEKLNSFGVPVFALPGNWDWTPQEGRWAYLKKNHWKKIIAGLKNIKDCHLKRRSFGGYDLIGHGVTSGPEKPVHKEDIAACSRKELRHREKAYRNRFSKGDALFRKAKKPVIFLSHNVPFNTSIDKITNKESPRYGYHFGSLIAREIIEKHQPVVCVGGHMHEHFKRTNIRKTPCINAGFGSFVNVLLELNGKVKTTFFDPKGQYRK